jgi:hypothetical protein
VPGRIGIGGGSQRIGDEDASDQEYVRASSTYVPHRVDEIAFHHALAGGYRMRTTMRPIERISMFACVAPDLRDAGCCRSGRRRPAEMPVDREKF